MILMHVVLVYRDTTVCSFVKIVLCVFQAKSSMESPLRCPLPPGGQSSPREEEAEEEEAAEEGGEGVEVGLEMHLIATKPDE